MANTTATAPAVSENDIEVFTRTVPEIQGERCDACGGTVAARYVASKETQSLFFCAHHIRGNEANLRLQGFSITPEDTSFDAGVVKV